VTPTPSLAGKTWRNRKSGLFLTRNDALDCFVYNLAALEILNPNFERMAQNLKVKEKPVEEKGPLPKNVKQKPPRLQGCGFVDAWRWLFLKINIAITTIATQHNPPLPSPRP